MAEYLNQLTSDEFKLLKKFIHSPLFNNHFRILKYFELLNSLYPEINKTNTSQKEIHKFIYGRRKFIRRNIHKIESDFGKLFDRFLIFLESGNDEERDNLLLLNALRKRKMHNRYKKILNAMRQKQEEEQYKNERFYLTQIDLEDELLNAEFLNIKDRKNILIRKSLNINYYSVLQNLISYSQLILHQRGKSANPLRFPGSMYKDVIAYTEKNLNEFRSGHHDIVITYFAVKMYSTLDDKYYDELMKFYKSKKKEFTFETTKNLFVILSIFRRMKKFENAGEYGINNRKLSGLYDMIYIKTDIYSEYFSKGREMDDVQMLEVVQTTVELNKKNRLPKFLERHGVNFKAGWRKDGIYYLNAGDHFINRDLENALRSVSEITHRNSNIFSDSRMLTCLILFEMKDFEYLKIALRNFRKYSKENPNLPDLRRKVNQDFLKYFNAFLKIYLSESIRKKKEYESLRIRMEKETVSVYFREWFVRRFKS
jgi:hypothetical protein